MTAPIDNGDLVTRTQMKATTGALLRDPVLLVDGDDSEMCVRFASLSTESLAAAAFGMPLRQAAPAEAFVDIDDDRTYSQTDGHTDGQTDGH